MPLPVISACCHGRPRSLRRTIRLSTGTIPLSTDRHSPEAAECIDQSGTICSSTQFDLRINPDFDSRDGGRAITSFAIVTTDAAPSVTQYHNRMPVVLDDTQFDDWMRGTPDQAAKMMKPYAGEIDAWEIGPDVGNVRNNRPEQLDRVGLL